MQGPVIKEYIYSGIIAFWTKLNNFSMLVLNKCNVGNTLMENVTRSKYVYLSSSQLPSQQIQHNAAILSQYVADTQLYLSQKFITKSKMPVIQN